MGRVDTLHFGSLCFGFSLKSLSFPHCTSRLWERERAGPPLLFHS